MRIAKLLHLIVLASFPLISSAQSINGAWQTIQTVSDGNRTRTVYLFHRDGDRLTGKVEVAWGNLAIENGTMYGGHFTFQIHMGASIWSYEGQLQPHGLTIVLHDPKSTPVSLKAERISHDLNTAARAASPPPLHAVRANGLALLPPMGWNSWNHFQGHIDDATVRQIADAIVRSGMRDAGYIYVNIDDTWEGQRDAKGEIHPNKKFPNMKALADYLHRRGLKLGIYSSPGPETCAGYPGSYRHEKQDAHTFAQWGVDYLKYDWCSAFRLYPDPQMRAVYQKMGDALEQTGRPMVYSLSAGGKDDIWTWGRLAGANLWRTTDDINDSYKRVSEIGFSQSPLARWAGPGGWNDPDMLEIGNGGLDFEESKTHMSLWAILAAPLLTGNDLRSMSAQTKSILLNREVIAIDQDKLGKQGKRILTMGKIEIWRRELSDRSVAIAIFNQTDSLQTAQFSWRSLGFSQPPSLRDLWRHNDLPDQADHFSAQVPAHGVLLLKARPR